MKYTSAHLIYFSPTGTTRKILHAIAKGLNPEQIHNHDLTYPGAQAGQNINSGIIIIGIPVYAGRVPEVCLERMTNYTAAGQPTVLVALYGNRAYEDALVELRDVATAQGFNVVAAGAFIGEHSYSTAEKPIAAKRPDNDDLNSAVKFGHDIAAKIESNNFCTPKIAGDIPYKERVTFGGIAPETDATKCTLCGHCAKVCPVRIITVTNAVITQAENCIMCSACVRICPADARPFNHPVIEERRELLIKNCSAPKQPELFL